MKGRLSKHLSSSQREFFLRGHSAIGSRHYVPGARKTLLIEMLVLILVEKTSTDSVTNPVKLVVTEANVSMCAELHGGLETALGSSACVVRVGYDVERSVDLFEEWFG